VGETQERPCELSFNNSLRVDFQGARMTSDGGLILVHELWRSSGIVRAHATALSDSRPRKRTQLPPA